MSDTNANRAMSREDRWTAVQVLQKGGTMEDVADALGYDPVVDYIMRSDPDRQAAILQAADDGKTMTEIAEEFGIKQARARQLTGVPAAMQPDLGIRVLHLRLRDHTVRHLMARAARELGPGVGAGGSEDDMIAGWLDQFYARKPLPVKNK